MFKHNPTVFSSRTSSKRDSHGYARGWCILIRIWCQVLYNRILKIPICHITAGTASERLTLQGCPNLAHDKLTIRGDNPPSRDTPSILGIPVHKLFKERKTIPRRSPGESDPCPEPRLSIYGLIRLCEVDDSQKRHRRLLGRWTNTHVEHWPGG